MGIVVLDHLRCTVWIGCCIVAVFPSHVCQVKDTDALRPGIRIAYIGMLYVSKAVGNYGNASADNNHLPIEDIACRPYTSMRWGEICALPVEGRYRENVDVA